MNKYGNEEKVYSRKLIRKILRNSLKTNKIKKAFHNKKWLEKYLKTI